MEYCQPDDNTRQVRAPAGDVLCSAAISNAPTMDLQNGNVYFNAGVKVTTQLHAVDVATVDSTGCSEDTDGDGVFDGIDRCPDTPSGVRVDAVVSNPPYVREGERADLAPEICSLQDPFGNAVHAASAADRRVGSLPK